MRKISLFLLVLPGLFMFQCRNVPIDSNFAMGPYLQAVTHNSIYVLFESALIDTVHVIYETGDTKDLKAKSESYEMTTRGTYVHNVHLMGLLPDTEYEYIIKQGSYESDNFKFRTAVEEGKKFRFAWWADNRSGPEIFAKIVKHVEEHEPLFLVLGGDLAVNPNYGSWKEDFFLKETLGLIARVPFFNSPGNHEEWTTNTWAFTQNPWSDSKTQDFYSFDYGDIHFLMLNNELDYSRGSAQYKFAQQDLASTNKKWKIVASHVPAYCGGGHDEDDEMVYMAENLFKKYYVDVHLSGHSHFYQHNVVGTTQYIVAGTAGSPLYDPVKRWYTKKSKKDYHFLIIDAEPNKLLITAYDHNNKKFDEIELRK